MAALVATDGFEPVQVRELEVVVRVLGAHALHGALREAMLRKVVARMLLDAVASQQLGVGVDVQLAEGPLDLAIGRVLRLLEVRAQPFVQLLLDVLVLEL